MESLATLVIVMYAGMFLLAFVGLGLSLFNYRVAGAVLGAVGLALTIQTASIAPQAWILWSCPMAAGIATMVRWLLLYEPD